MTSQEIRIKLFSFDFRLLDRWVKKIVEIAHDNNTSIKGPIPLPTETKIYTVLKSPHVNKPSMEQFEKKEHKRLIIITNFNPQLISQFQKLNLPTSINLSLMVK